MLPPNLSDTAATSQDGLSQEFIAAIAGRQCYIQDATGRGLCTWHGIFSFFSFIVLPLLLLVLLSTQAHRFIGLL